MSKQVTTRWHLKKHDNISVYDYHSAVDAIYTIIDQGEGNNPCNPITKDELGQKDLSHYFMFQSIAEERGIQVVKANTKTADAASLGEPSKVRCTRQENKDGI